jgi:hypothetical protein
LRFALGSVDRCIALQQTNVASNGGPLVHELKQLNVDRIDAVAQGF